VTTVDTDAPLTIAFERDGDPRGGRRDWHLTVVAPGEAAIASPRDDGAGETRDRTPGSPRVSSPIGDLATTVRFHDAGIVDTVVVIVEGAGSLGLTRWRRTCVVPVAPIHVAPTGTGPLVDVERSSSTHEGQQAASRGNHLGDIDGVRTWRDGDGVGSVHWPSALRAGELIVHDRAAASEETWVVDLDATPLVPPAQLRATLDEGCRRGHTVAVRDGGSDHVVEGDDDAARWAARVARRAADVHSTATRPTRFWQRQLRITAHEPDTSVRAPARWAAGAAALASIGMLIGALGWSVATTGLVAAGVVAGCIVSLLVARRPGGRPVAMQIAIATVVAIALASIAVGARDVDGLLTVLRGPMPELLVLFFVLHGFEVVDRRTLRVHQAITVVVAAYAAGLRIDDALGWWIAGWAAAWIASLLLTTRSAGVLRDAPTPTARCLVRPVAWSVGAVLATLALLSVVPIPDGPARLGLPALSNDAPTVAAPGTLAGADGTPAAPSTNRDGDTGSLGTTVGYPGFTDTLDTSVRGELGDQVVMRVRAPEPAFWRGQTFTEFDGRVWTVDREIGTRQDGPLIDVAPTLGDAVGPTVRSEEFVQTYTIEADLPNLVLAASRPSQVVFDGSVWTRPDGALWSDVTLTAGSVYTVISERPQITAADLRAQGDVGEVFDGFRSTPGGAAVDPFLELPASTTQRTIDLATGLRTPGESTYDTILAYERWLGANTEYDLDAPVPPEGADAVDDFLFESRLGYCEQIASTLTVMLRSQGVPARLATGYVPGERDRVSGVWKVRASDAHAWVEVWFPQTGWQPFDPTASVPLSGEVDGGTVGGDLIGAATSSIASHRLELGALAVVAMVAWACARALARRRHRRRRGRWGLLQDRFAAAAPATATASVTVTDDAAAAASMPATPTNRTLARRFSAPNDELAARVADELDRAAFDPSWVDDDDDRYRQIDAAVTTLERS
jgi:transglutaminase-like putative cysteine protease